MGKGGVGLSEVQTIFQYCASVSIWIILNVTSMNFNKFILDKNQYNWPFPISLIMIHMAFCSSVPFTIIRIFKLAKSAEMTSKLYFFYFVPVGAIYAFSLGVSISAYIHLSLSYTQMLKALFPVLVSSIFIFFKSSTLTKMISISFAVAIVAYGDVGGVFLHLGIVAFEAAKLYALQFGLVKRMLALKPITCLYYVAPCCLAFLFVPWLFLEFPILIESSSFRFFDIAVFGANSVCAFAFNWAAFLLIWMTSPVRALMGY